MLTPAVARSVAAACPGTKQYADALVRGMNAAEAAAANAPFSRCASATRLFALQWKNDYGRIALAAAELSQGLLAHDPVLVKRAADATQAWRDSTPATDAEVRSWDAIPDIYFAATRVAVIQDDPPPCLRLHRPERRVHQRRGADRHGVDPHGTRRSACRHEVQRRSAEGRPVRVSGPSAAAGRFRQRGIGAADARTRRGAAEFPAPASALTRRRRRRGELGDGGVQRAWSRAAGERVDDA